MVSLAAGDGNEAADEETAKASKTPYCDWIFSLDQDWLLNVILPWLGAEELLLRSCDVCPIWRQWCNESLKVLDIGNDYQRVRSNSTEGTSTTRALRPLFLPLVPSNLLELNLSGTWTTLQARELGTIRKGCRLRKLGLASVRLHSFSYRELLLFAHLEELDISHSNLDVAIPCLRFVEPAGDDQWPERRHSTTPGQGESSSSASRHYHHHHHDNSCGIPPQASLSSHHHHRHPSHGSSSTSVVVANNNNDPHQHRRNVNKSRQNQRYHYHGPITVPSNPTLARLVSGGVLRSGTNYRAMPPPTTRSRASNGGVGIGSDGRGFDINRGSRGRGRGGGMIDLPRFASTLKRLTAVKCRLWTKWDLSRFEPLRALEVSFANRTTLEQLARKAEAGLGLTELSVCDLALRNLVRATELQELQQAVAAAEIFRLRRVDVVKEVPHFAYLRAVLVRLNSLQVLELTDVALDDAMLQTLGECLSLVRTTAEGPATTTTTGGGSSGGSASFRLPAPAAPSPINVYGTRTGLSSLRYPPLATDGVGVVGPTCTGGGASSGNYNGEGGSSNDGSGCGGEVISLRTLVLESCERVSASAFEAFLSIVGGGGGGSNGDGDRVYGGAIGGGRYSHTVGTEVGTTFRAGTERREGGASGSSSGGGSVGGIDGGMGQRQGNQDAAAASAVGVGRLKSGGDGGALGNGMALSTVRLIGCKALDDRGLKLLAAGVRDRLKDLQVTGSFRLTDNGVEAVAATCPRLLHVDVSGCLNVTSNALRILLDKGRMLRSVKAWGIRAAGRMATASLRAAYEARGVDLAWARPLPSQSSAIIAGVGEALLPSSSQLPFQKPGETGGEGGEEPCVGRGSRKGCSFGCGAVPTALDAVDHVEVCPLSPVACLLRADGCSWRGPRPSRRRHLKECSFWQVKCPVCCHSVHHSDFGDHVLQHSVSNDTPAMRPPGCPLRAYGCRTCRETSFLPAAAAAAPSQRQDEVGGGRGGHVIARCPYYRMVCRSCSQEVSRRTWDDGMHVCAVRRRVDVLAKHPLPAGMVRNRQWFQFVRGYFGGGAAPEEEDDPRDGAFHGVNPMCSMPSGLSEVLPLPGPAGAPASPATPP